MKPPGKSTLYRMQQTAAAEQQRLELLQEPPAYAVRRRDDFAGIVRLIEAILSDQEIINRLKARMSAKEILAIDSDVEVADR